LPQPPPAKGFAGCVDGKQFGVVDGIFAALSQVVGTGNDLAILGNHRANGHFTQSGSGAGFFQRGLHQLFIGHCVTPHGTGTP